LFKEEINMRSRSRLLIPLVVLALVTVACGINLPNSTTIDAVATNVAATVEAIAGTAAAALTPEAHTLPTVELPTVAPTTEVLAPLHVSFVSADGDLYVWDETMSTAHKLVDSGDVSTSTISQDGSLVAFTRSSDFTNYSLEVINFDGTNQRVLMDAAAFATLPRPSGALSSFPSQMAFVPNSHTLAFNTRIQFEGPGLAFNPTLTLANIDTNLISNILYVGESWKFTYSPDGSKIAISIPTGISTYNADGTLIKDSVLVYPFVNTASEYAWVASPRWSADSTLMVAGVPPQDPWTEPVGDGSVWRMAADGTYGEQTLSTPMMYFPGGFVFSSPDLARIIFFTRLGASTDNTFTLHTANLDGTNNVSYTTGMFDQAVSWSPDNNHFFYSVRDGAGTISYIGNVGGLPVLVPDITNATDSTWVDANRYLVVTAAGGSSSLLLGNIASPTGVIYNGTGSNYLTFSVNR
jgi:hypothetical protein